MRRPDRPDELDRLLAGEAPDDRLAVVLSRMREGLVAAPGEGTAARHLAEICRLAEEHAHEIPVGSSPALTWRSRVAHVFGYTATKIALGVGVAAAATGGLASQGNLPDPVQRAVSSGASYIGFDFPHPEDLLTDLDATPVEELPDPDTGIPQEPPADDRSESTRGAEVDAPDDDAPAEEAPVEEVPADDDAPPVDPPRDDTDEPPPAGDDRPAPPVDPPPADPPGGKGTSSGDGDEVQPSSTDPDGYRP